jgi:hypothetical protein
MSHVLPVPKEIRDLFEDLLGRPVEVSPGEPVRSTDMHQTLVSLYVDDGLHLAAVLGMSLPLAVFAGAAIGLMPPGGAKDFVKERDIPPMIAENVTEICNVVTSLLNRPGAPHLKLYQTFLPGDQPPADAAGYLIALGRRLDLKVDVSGYGEGRFSLALAG